MKPTILSILLTLTGLIAWAALIYSLFAFIKADPNPFCWGQDDRAGVVLVIFIYVCFMPPIFLATKEEVKDLIKK